MFIDWLTIHQDHDLEIPLISDRAYQLIDTETGEAGKIVQSTFKHEGSFSSVISVSISGNRIKVSGNPSRFNRLDNLFGLTSIDACVDVYNSILLSLGLPVFTKCTKIQYRKGVKTTHGSAFSDGATLGRIDVTTNVSTGEGNELDYIAAISTLPYRNSVPRLHTNGQTADWLSSGGNASLIYPSVYNKSHDLKTKALREYKRKYGVTSSQYKYIQKVIAYCKNQGLVRFEQKLQARYLSREGLQFWGLQDFEQIKKIHNEFLNIDNKLQVTAMTLETISEKLLSENICSNTKAANMTAFYAYNWFNGQNFDLSKSQVKIHRSRLRKLGIDIARPCNISRFSPVYVKQAKEVNTSVCTAPTWYEMPKLLRAV